MHVLFGTGLRAAAAAAAPHGWLWARGIIRRYTAIPKLAIVRQDILFSICYATLLLVVWSLFLSLPLLQLEAREGLGCGMPWGTVILLYYTIAQVVGLALSVPYAWYACSCWSFYQDRTLR